MKSSLRKSSKSHCEAALVQGALQYSLAPHRTLRLSSGNIALLAIRNTGWCIVNADGYRILLSHFGKTNTVSTEIRSSSSGIYRELWEAGLLLVDGQPHPQTIKQMEKNYPSSLLLKLTGACNFRCTYCYDYDSSRYHARLESKDIERTITFLLSHREKLSLIFHGGEPLLQFDLIKSTVEFALRVAGDPKRVSFAIQTNGSCFTPTVVEFLESHSFSVGISLDAIDDEGNALRVFNNGRSTLSRVQSVLKDYGEFARKCCGFLAVASRTSSKFIPPMALWLQDQGISGLTITFLDGTGRGKELHQEKLVPEEAVELYEQILSFVRSGAIRSLALRSILSRIDNFFTFQPRDFCHRGPCAASDEFLVLDAEGTIRSCDCVYDDFFVLQNNTTNLIGIDVHPARQAIDERHAWLRDHGPSCHTCPLFGLCGGTCVAKAIASNGRPHSIDPIECALVRHLYPAILEELDSTGSRPLLSYYQLHQSIA